MVGDFMNSVFILIVSFIALLWAANHLVTGAAGLVPRLKLSPLAMGLTVVALSTSAPELIVAIIASIKDKNDLVVGNVMGANIANIGLVLGITILVKPMTLNYPNLKKAYPIIIIAMLFVYSLILDGFLGKVDGCLFLIACIAMMSFFIYFTKPACKKREFNEFKSIVNAGQSLKTNLFNIILGLIILPISAKYLVMSAADIARWSGMSELTIGLTIMAIGTTLPELATAITAALKDEEEIAVGTILGSNLYNLLLILAFPAIINPAKISNTILWRDMPTMLALTLLLFFLSYQYKKKLSPWHGGILLLIYCSYLVSMAIKAHP